MVFLIKNLKVNEESKALAQKINNYSHTAAGLLLAGNGAKNSSTKNLDFHFKKGSGHFKWIMKNPSSHRMQSLHQNNLQNHVNYFIEGSEGYISATNFTINKTLEYGYEN